MSDYSKTDLGTGYNTNTAINTELGKIETAVNSKMDKSGSTMTGQLDMNSNKILNVSPGVLASDGVNLKQLTSVIQTGATTGDYRQVKTVTAMTALTGLTAGTDVVQTAEFSTGNGGGGTYDVVLTSSVTPNGYNIIQGVADITISFVLRVDRIAFVKQFGATGGGSTDDAAAIQSACTQYKNVDFGSASDSYDVASAITLQTGQKLVGRGCTITMTSADTEIFNVESKSDIEITGFKFETTDTNYLDSDAARAVGVFGGTAGSNIRVYKNTFTGFVYSAARFKAQTDCAFYNNIVIGPGVSVITSSAVGRIYGCLVDVGCIGFEGYGNFISETAQGFRIEQASNFTLSSNRIFDIRGQHGFYVGANCHDFAIVGNTVDNTRLQGIKVQPADYSLSDNTNFTISSNTVRDSTSHGILVGAATASATYKSKVFSITGNAVINSLAAGIRTDNCDGGTISGNTVKTCTESGIMFDEDVNLLISDNTIIEAANSGIRDVASSDFITIKDNTIKDCCTANTVGDEYGIYINGGGSEIVIDGNTITDANANMERAVNLTSIDYATASIINNICPDSTAGGFRVGATTTALRAYKDNLFNSAANDPVTPSIASATTLSVPTLGNIYNITGTTTINNITANGHQGHVITLVFNASLTVNHGSGINLAGAVNFSATTNDTLTLACRNGTAWFEVGRTVI